MLSGPSHEELKNYWKNSRQYFDELAKHYQTADPEYYSKYILPFYQMPLQISSGTSKSKGFIIVIAIGISILIAGIAALFFVLQFNATDKNYIEKKVKDSTSSQKDIIDIEDFTSEDHFIEGSKELGNKNYDKAEEHIRKIKPGDKHYREAQQLLEAIKLAKKYSK